ncbi:MAG: CDP-diacylglycerol--glycerol-3-phosphate 3-phosphatidyltransferase [Clostridia bacterium]|nr:CDP-diacylglycerol--glycerol-3-phosphate 3-phosphatidyltransferase [Clostridia bacterium]
MNLPNKITMIRILLIPFMIFFYLANFIPGGWGKIIALVIFIGAALTDMLDGHLARKHRLVTDLGKFLDPIADKLLVMSALLLVVCDGTIVAPYGFFAAVIIIGRELIISALRQVAAAKNIVIAADWWGKIKTFITDISIAFLILLSFFYQNGFASGTIFLDVFQTINYILLGGAISLTIVSGINYLVKNWKVIK